MSNDIVIQLLMSIKDCPVNEQQKVMLAIINDYRNGGPINYPELSILSQAVVFGAVKHMRETDDRMRETNALICETSAQNLAYAGTISPKSKICGNNTPLMSPHGGNNDNRSESVEQKDAVEQILEDKDHHQMWFEKTCCNLEWGDLLKENLEWVLVYFRAHLYQVGKEATLHDVRQFKAYFFNYTRNPISSNQLLRDLHLYLDNRNRELGVITEDADFRTFIQENYPQLYRMNLPLTCQQLRLFVETYGNERVKQALVAANMSKKALYTADAFALVKNFLQK